MPPETAKLIDHVNAHHDEFMKGFYKLLRFRSVSTDPIYQSELNQCAQWIAHEASQVGLKNARLMPTGGHPIVYAEWLEAGPDQPTVLFYAHYDVQPPDPLELWEHDPFEPVLRGGRLYARGVADNKAGVYVTLKAFEAYFSIEGKLPINVKVLFEGEEESGSPNIESFLFENKELLKADYMVINDGTNAPGQPIVPAGVRGIISGEVKICGPQRDLHSGSYGGWVQNPAHVLGQIIASFHDPSGRVAIDGFYDGVEPLTSDEQKLLRLAVENQSFIGELMEESGVTDPWAKEVAPLGERMWALPCLDINGVIAGYQGIGSKTIIPAEASFKFSARLAPGQDPDHIEQVFAAHVMRFENKHIKISISFETHARGVKSIPKGRAADAINRAFAESWGKEPLIYPEGGSVPLLGIFDRDFKMPILSMAYVTGGSAHSPNEYIHVDTLLHGVQCAVLFLFYMKNS